MTGNRIVPAHILKMYVWELLLANEAMYTIGYDGLVPVIPLAEEPQLEQTGKPYLVYGYSEQSSGALKEIRSGVFSLRVCASTFSEITTIINVIARAFENFDVSASSINEFSSTRQEFAGVRFTSTDVTYISGGDAPETEGGKAEGVINIAYRYLIRSQVKVYQSNGTWA